MSYIFWTPRRGLPKLWLLEMPGISLERRQQTFDLVERITELPMVLLSLAMVPLILAPELLSLSAAAEDVLFTVEMAIWAVFALELGVKLYLAPARGLYLRRHWFDVLIVAVPFLRPLRVLRSTRALRALRLLSFGARFSHSARAVLANHGLQYVLVVALVTVFASAALVSVFESEADGNIGSFGEALWWAITTITTVGYGDRFPVTPEGRGIAVFLMLVGISVFSFLTANIAAYLVAPKDEENAASLDEVLAAMRRLEARVEALQHAVQGGAEPLSESAIPDDLRVSRN
jgi:voltage-gated potassium channel